MFSPFFTHSVFSVFREVEKIKDYNKFHRKDRKVEQAKKRNIGDSDLSHPAETMCR